VQEDTVPFAISLGVYRTEEAAQARLDQVQAKGARTAVIGTRQTPVQKVYLQVRELAEGMQPKLVELRNAFPGTELKSCKS
jgi:hypothetical protein